MDSILQTQDMHKWLLVDYDGRRQESTGSREHGLGRQFGCVTTSAQSNGALVRTFDGSRNLSAGGIDTIATILSQSPFNRSLYSEVLLLSQLLRSSIHIKRTLVWKFLSIGSSRDRGIVEISIFGGEISTQNFVNVFRRILAILPLDFAGFFLSESPSGFLRDGLYHWGFP